MVAIPAHCQTLVAEDYVRLARLGHRSCAGRQRQQGDQFGMLALPFCGGARHRRHGGLHLLNCRFLVVRLVPESSSYLAAIFPQLRLTSSTLTKKMTPLPLTSH